MRLHLFLSSILFASIVGCSSSNENRAADPPLSSTPVDTCTEEGATECDGLEVRTCTRTDGALVLSPPVECPGEQSCREGACQDPTPRMRAQAKSIEKLVDDLGASTAWHEPVDVLALKSRETLAVLKGDASDQPFFGAAWRVMNAFPQGHQSLYSTATGVCGQAMAYQHRSRFGVCGRPSADGLVVTVAKANNLLGLSVGDVIVRAGEDEGDAIYETAYMHPTCGGTFPSRAGRRTSGAASFFGVVPAGTTLTVRSPSGMTREVVVPAESDPRPTSCQDPLGRNTAVYAEATVRPDGVAVIRLPSFFPFDKTIPNTNDPTVIQQFIDEYQAEIVSIFDTVKTAPAIVWDARANIGGMTPVGLAIVSGFASARPTTISYCRYRVPRGDLAPDRYAVYEITPGGPFAYAGKVAVVTDGMAYSAGDYFPYAVLKATDVPVVGSSSAGAYGASGGELPVAGPPALTAVFDANRCFDASNDQPLEGRPPAPTIAVDYDPADLAAGKDTLLEKAVEALGL